MSEGIDFRDDGTIVVQFDGETWTLRRPKFGHWRKYSRAFSESAQRAIAPLREALDAVKEADASGDDEAMTEALATFNKINSEDLMIDENVRLLAEIFDELGDRPLPTTEDGNPDVDQWPPWLVLPPARDDNGTPGPAVPARIVVHWRNVPKVSSSTPPG